MIILLELCWIRNGSADDLQKDSETIESEMLEDIPVEVMTNSLNWKKKILSSNGTSVV